MKALSAGVLLVNIILTIPSAPAQTKWFLNTEHLNGPVHTVQIELSELYMVENKEVESARRPHQRVVYDRNGNEIERINFNRDGSIENRNVQIIDANGRIAGWEDYEPEAGGKRQHLTNRSEWIYDKEVIEAKRECIHRGISPAEQLPPMILRDIWLPRQ